MESFDLQLQQNHKTTLVIVLVPAVTVLLFIYGMVQFPNLPEWLLITCIIVFLALLMLSVLWLVTNRVMVNCKVQVGAQGMILTPKKGSILYPKSLAYDWHQVTSVTDDLDMRTGQHYAKIRFTDPKRTIILTAQNGADEYLEAFCDSIYTYKQFS
ncbi:MAG: hypothetical protein EOO68_09165 [Moraxellaceae bacterium]|nr:MAG: hypothetical protein EOO68_09165 [Moraxellaceae bacterium]